jgi:hypothetical protein
VPGTGDSPIKQKVLGDFEKELTQEIISQRDMNVIAEKRAKIINDLKK